MKPPTPKQQLAEFLSKYLPEVSSLARKSLAKVQKRLPGAVMMVYDNYNALVIGFGATERPSEAILSLAVFPDHVTLVFIHGKRLPDPHKLLNGSGNQVRHLRLPTASRLDDPGVSKLIDEAIKRSSLPFDAKAKQKLVIRAVSAKQRPRRPRVI